MILGHMESGLSLNKINPAETNLVVFESNGCNNISVNIGIVKKTFRAYNINVSYKTVDENWEEELNNAVKRVVFVISSDTFITRVKKRIAHLRERNNNVSNVADIEVLVILETDDDDDDDDDDNDDSDDDFQFDAEDEKEKDIIKVDSLNNVYKWWPNVLLFLRPKDVLDGPEVKRKYGCFFVFSENSNKESEWFKNHRDSFEKLGIRCLRQEKDSKIQDDVYLKSSVCAIVYVNNKRHTEKIKDLVKKAIENGCKIRLYLENARTEFAEVIRDECQVILSGTTIHAHLASLMKDLDISKSY